MAYNNSIILIGFMGAGKTSLGKASAHSLKVPFLDTDNLIEKREGMSVSEIFASYGEKYFRLAETQILRELLDRRGIFVLSAGGGVALREENRSLLKKIGTVIYLKCSVNTLCNRLQSDTRRPLLHQGSGTLSEKVMDILSQREKAYLDACNVIIENDHKSLHQVVDEICLIAHRR